MTNDPLAQRVAAKYTSAKEKDSVRLKAVQAELAQIRDRLRELAEEVYLDPATVKKLSKEYRSKATWGDFPRAGEMLQKVATGAQTVHSAIDMGVVLAESVSE